MADQIETPNTSEPTRIQEIKANIRAGEQWLKTGNYSKANYREEFWKRNKAYLRCDWSDKNLIKDDADFHANIPYANYRTIKPSLIFHDPYMEVEALKPEFERDENGDITTGDDGMRKVKSDNFAAARLMEIRLNHEIRQCRVKDVMKRCVGHAKGHYGIGWAKVGHQEMTLSQFNNDRDNKTNYWVDWVDPRDVPFDWRAVEAKRMRWIAQRIVMPKKDVFDLGLKVPENYACKLPEHLADRQKQIGSQKDFPGQDVEFWEYHDLDQGTVDWVLMDGPGEDWFYMQETSEAPYPFEGSSFMPLVIDDDDDDLIGVTDIQPIEDHVRALNRMRSREVHHMDNYGTGVIAEESAVSKDEKKRYEKTPYGFWLKVKDGFINKIKVQGTPSMGSDHYNMSEVLKEEMRTTIGITDYQQGGGSVQRKATEAQLIRSDAAVRIEDNRDAVGGFGVEIARRLMAMIQEFDDEQDFYNVANEEFDDDFVEVLKEQYGYNPKVPFLGISRKQIQGEFHLRPRLEDMIQQPKEVRAAQLARSLESIKDPYVIQKLEEKGFDIAEAVIDMFELNGVNTKKYTRGGPAQIPAIVENQMFKKGMEVPDPHRKDDNGEHILAHGPLRRELEQAVAAIEGKIQKIESGLQMVPEMMAGSPEAATIQDTANAHLEKLYQERERLTQILRRVRLHTQGHDLNELKKSGAAGAAMTAGGGQQQQTGKVPNMVDVNASAQPPGPAQGF